MDSAILAAYEIAALAGLGGLVTGCILGYAWRGRTANSQELISEEEIQPLLPMDDPGPLYWQHLAVLTEKEQSL